MKKLISLCFGTVALLGACGGSDELATTTESEGTRNHTALVPVPYAFTRDSPEQTTWVEDRGGRAIFQGDIDLGPIDQLTRRRTLSATAEVVQPEGIVRTGVSRWDNDAVVVVDDVALPADYRSNEWWSGMKLVMANTPVRFTRDKEYYKTTNYSGSVPTTTYDYLALRWEESNPSFAGQSQVGRVGGGQPLTLTRSANSAVVVHELMHALGIWHEQSRADRNSYVTVNYANIRPDVASQFSIHAQDGAGVGQYDYCSVMHYPRFFPASWVYDPGTATLVPNSNFSCNVVNADGGWRGVTDIGQRQGLSVIDIDTIKSLRPTAVAGKPFAYAGADQNVIVYGSGGTTISLNGSASYHPVSGSSITRYSWIPVGWSPDCYKPYPAYQCPGNPIVNASSAQASVTVDTSTMFPGQTTDRKYRMTVTDASNRSMSDVVTVIVRRY